MVAETLLHKHAIISGQMTRERLRVVLIELEKVLQAGVPGDVVEFGCYIGTTSLFIQRLLLETAYPVSDRTIDKRFRGREFHVNDSFAGLPEKSARDLSGAGEQFRAGEISASKKQLIKEFQKANLKLPIIHKAWFSELTPQDVPEQIAFAFLDAYIQTGIRTPFSFLSCLENTSLGV